MATCLRSGGTIGGELAVTALQFTFNWISNPLDETQVVVARYQILDDFVVARKPILVFDFP